MSQSDYLKYKKIATELKVDHQDNHPSVLSSNNYISFLSYAMKNDVKNTKLVYNKVVPSTTQVIYDIEQVVTNCPTFECSDSSTRPNRIAHDGRMCDVHPLNWNQINNKDVYEMNKILNKTNYDEKNCCPTSAN
jgi:hypothetical protein